MLLEISKLSKHFGGIKAVEDVSFGVSEGSITALIGPNGAGKTTLFNLISGTLQGDQGSILLKGKEMLSLKPYQIAEAGITRTFQNLQLFSQMTLIENVMAGAYLRGKRGFIKTLFTPPKQCKEEKKIREEALVLLEEVGLLELANLPAAALPFGQQRLLEIARALAAKPSVLLLDEPAAGLNDLETAQLARYLKVLQSKKIALLLIEHDMEMVMSIADRIVVLNFGQLLATGTPAEIQSNAEVIKAYLGEEDYIA